MAQENIWLCEYNEGSYNMAGYYLTDGNFFEYEDSYNYYDIDVDKILLCKKKVIMNILLDIMMYIKLQLHHYN